MTAATLNIYRSWKDDGIGPQRYAPAATLRMLATAERTFGVKFAFEGTSSRSAAHRREGTTFPGVIGKGPPRRASARAVFARTVSPPVAEGSGSTPPADCAERLDLYADIQRARFASGYPAPLRLSRRLS